ncbi:isoprenyl transferase [bacterium]|nr:isoprenyl transferase [bacterium]
MDYEKQCKLIQDKLPKHIAIIMDGNGRWAKKQGKARIFGHKEGINSVREIVKTCGEFGIKFLTLYTFSQENWKRPELEVSFLMSLLLTTIKKEVKDLNKNNVRVLTIGNLQDLPEKARKGMEDAIKLTAKNTGLTLVLALSYSSRTEILLTTKKIAQKVVSGEITAEQINEKLFSDSLYTKEIPDPDLLIRTSGELRLSNFLLWQLAYTEIYVTEAFWPDFRRNELCKAMLSYSTRERRFGLVSEQLSSK